MLNSIIQAIIPNLTRVATDHLSKTAGSASVLYIIHLFIAKLADTYIDLLPWDLTPDQIAYIIWGVLVLILLVAPAEWLKSRIMLLKLLLGNLSKK